MNGKKKGIELWKKREGEREAIRTKREGKKKQRG